MPTKLILCVKRDYQPGFVATMEQTEANMSHKTQEARPKRTRATITLLLLIISVLVMTKSTHAQDTVTGAFEGTVTDSRTGAPLKGADVEITNQQTGLKINIQTDNRGRFYQGLILPGVYNIRVALANYQTHEHLQLLKITYTGEVVPVPVSLEPAPPGTPAVATPTTSTTAAPGVEDTDIPAGINRLDGRRSGSFSEEEVVTLPLGATTFVRTFDELALLLPGVAPPPQTLGNVAGPGVGAGVGSAGQFSVNGLRSRGNNFTVDGSDNNDEEIGVRRQGFVALIPQPVESIQEYQVITLLAPAQFGRNLGAQVNAVSKSGGNTAHGTLYGLFNSSALKAHDHFDFAGGPATFPITANGQAVFLDGDPLAPRNPVGGENPYDRWQYGFVLGGPIGNGTSQFFISAEH